MPTEFHPVKMNLSKSQREAIVAGVKNRTPVSVRLSRDQLKGEGGVMLPLNNRQIKHLDKNFSKGMGAEVRLSKTQLRKVRSGGFLPLLIGLAELAVEAAPAIAEAVLATTAEEATRRTINKVAGDGVRTFTHRNPNPNAPNIIDSSAVGGEGIKDVLAKVGSVAKPVLKGIAQPLLKEGCKFAGKTVTGHHPLAEEPINRGCEALSKAVFGNGRRKMARKSTTF